MASSTSPVVCNPRIFVGGAVNSGFFFDRLGRGVTGGAIVVLSESLSVVFLFSPLLCLPTEGFVPFCLELGAVAGAGGCCDASAPLPGDILEALLVILVDILEKKFLWKRLNIKRNKRS